MNDDDRKLLELAAKAAGAKPYDWNTSRNGLFISNGVPMLLACGDPDGDWNPLADDGDALRLAVKLDLTIYRPGSQPGVLLRGDESHAIYEASCVRRAIVLAAAEIGKLQP